MKRARGISMFLLIVPALALSLLGLVMVGSTTARQAAATFGDPLHFVVRQVIALLLAALVAFAALRAGPNRIMRAAPLLFVAALLGALAVFVPGVGVRAAGARRWLHIGSLSGSPAPILTVAVGLIVSAWGRAGSAPLRAARGQTGAPPVADAAAGAGAPGIPAPGGASGEPIAADDALPRRALAIAMAFLAVLALVAEPDFSAAAIALAVGLVALAGLGIRGRRLVPAALVLAVSLALVASQFSYVGGRLHGFLSPERDRRGKGFEVLALARATSGATRTGTGLGHGEARRHLSSPASDYVFAVVDEELGQVAALAVAGAWLCICAAALLAARNLDDRRLRAAALSSGMAMLTPAALHMAVSVGLLPIIGVTMPFMSYDPAATVAAGAEVGIIASIVMSR
jgi:cell division protein FtsW